jgi:Kdo2-lipid IVA lauroyltransferase/acyltransferase
MPVSGYTALRDRVAAAAAQLVLRGLALLPLRTAQGVGDLAGALAWHANSRAAKVTLANLRACFPEYPVAEIERLARASLRATGRLSAEMGPLWYWPLERFESIVASVEGTDLIDEAQRTGQGAMVLAPHFGNWEVLNLYLGKRFGLTAMYDPPRLARLDPIVRRARMRAGSTLVPTSPAGVRRLHRTLQQGRLVGILPDQVPDPAAGVYAPFFGRPALTMTLVCRLARKSRPRVFIGTAQRLEAGAGFALRFEPLNFDPTEDDQGIAASINSAIECAVMRQPDQYQWEYKRFKKAPPGVARLY